MDPGFSRMTQLVPGKWIKSISVYMLECLFYLEFNWGKLFHITNVFQFFFFQTSCPTACLTGNDVRPKILKQVDSRDRQVTPIQSLVSLKLFMMICDVIRSVTVV